MNKENDISKKVVIVLIITLVTITLISWVTLTSYANATNYKVTRVNSYNNKMVGTVGISITNGSPSYKTKDKAAVGIKIS